MYKLYLENFNGKYLGCDFKDGVSETENINIVNYFKRHNKKYELVEEKTEIKEEIKEPSKTKTAKPRKKKSE